MSHSGLIQEVSASSWPKVLRAFQQLTPVTSFRGQQNAAWPLQTTLERSGSVLPAIDEHIMLRRFIRHAKFLLPGPVVPDDGDTFAWLAIMQHYGAPTRLLDFTRSPYVALFFAVEKPSEAGQPRAVWAVDVAYCQSIATDRLADEWKVSRGTVADRLSFDQSKLVSDLIYEHSAPAVVVVEPWNLDPRQAAQ